MLGEAKRDLIAAVMGAGLEFEEAAAPVKEDLREAVGVLLRRAQDAAAVRADVTPDAVLSLVVRHLPCRRAHRRRPGLRPARDRLRRVAPALRRSG